MAVRDPDLTSILTLTGVNNRVRKETSLTSSVLREAVNLDLSDAGKAQSRAGYGPPLVAATLGHSLWADPMVPFALFADGPKLRAFHADGTAQDVLADGLAAGMPVSYLRINDLVYWSNGAQRGVVDLDLTPMDWACPNPAGQPLVAAHAGGALTPGQVQVAVTFVDARGRESGCTVPVSFDLAAEGGLQLSNIPQPTDPNVSAVRLYTSKPNGTVLYRHAQIPVGATSYILLGTSDGAQLATFNLQPMPACHIVRELSGRMLGAYGRLLLWSEPLRYGLFNPAENYVALPMRIAIAEPVASGTDGAGVYVACGERTYWFGGRDPKDWQQVVAYPHGAVPGTTIVASGRVWSPDLPVAPVPAWLATNGVLVVGLPGGQLLPINEDVYAAAVGERGAAFLRERDGERHAVIAQTGAARNSRFGVADTATAVTYHHDGTVS